MVGAVLVRLFSLWGSVSATFQHTACPKNNGLGLLQKSPSLMKVQADHEVGIGEGEDFYPVDGGVNRACRGASQVTTRLSISLSPQGMISRAAKPLAQAQWLQRH